MFYRKNINDLSLQSYLAVKTQDFFLGEITDHYRTSVTALLVSYTSFFK